MSILQLSSKAQLDAFLDEQKRSNTKYVQITGTRDFSNEHWKPSDKNRIFFQRKHKGNNTPPIPFTGFPYISIGYRYFNCHKGRDKNRAGKLKGAEQRRKLGVKERPNMLGRTIKVNCPAVLNISRVATFTDKKFQIKKSTNYYQEKSSNLLKLALKETQVEWKEYYFIYVSPQEDHNHDSNAAIKGKEKRIHVRTSFKDVTEDDLKEIFSQFGAVVSCVIHMSKRMSDSYCVVEFENSDAADKAITQSKNLTVKGNVLKIRSPYIRKKVASKGIKEKEVGENEKDSAIFHLEKLLSDDNHIHEQDDDQEDQPLEKSVKRELNIDALRLQCANEHKSILKFIYLIEDESCLRNLKSSLEDLKKSLVDHVPLRDTSGSTTKSPYCFQVNTSLKLETGHSESAYLHHHVYQS